MNPPPSSPQHLPPPAPRLYRVLATLAGPLEKILGLTCRDFTQLASEKMDRPLTARERGRHLLHRLMCGICRHQEQRMQQLNRLAGETLRQAGADATVKLDAAARERIRTRLAQEMRRD